MRWDHVEALHASSERANQRRQAQAPITRTSRGWKASWAANPSSPGRARRCAPSSSTGSLATRRKRLRASSNLPHLRLAHIFDALSYYDDHRDEIERYIALNRVPVDD